MKIVTSSARGRLKKSDRGAPNGSFAFFGDRFDRNETKIFDAMGDFRRSRRQNRSVHDLADSGSSQDSENSASHYRIVVTRRISARRGHPARHFGHSVFDHCGHSGLHRGFVDRHRVESAR